MNLTFIIILCCMLSVFGRKFSDCDSKRCCLALNEEMPEMAAFCSSFGARDCVEGHGAECRWDCDPKSTRSREDGLKQRGFRKRRKSQTISGGKGSDQNREKAEWERFKRKMEAKYFKTEPKKKEIETVDDAIKFSQISSIDECGIETEWELDEIHAKKLLDGQKSRKSEKSSDDPIRRLYVFGEDGRIQITNPYDRQWSGQLYTGLVPGDVHGVETCSATLISPTWLITAAHCVYSADGWREGVEFHPGAVDTETFESIAIRSKMMYVPDSWQQRVQSDWTDYAAEFDVAWIELETNIGDDVGYLSLGSSVPSEQELRVNVVGYPADKASHTYWAQNCLITDNTDEYMMKSTDCDTWFGSSGGPIYTAQHEVIAVVSNHWENHHNGFRRITPTMKDMICGIIGECPSEPYCVKKVNRQCPW